MLGLPSTPCTLTDCIACIVRFVFVVHLVGVQHDYLRHVAADVCNRYLQSHEVYTTNIEIPHHSNVSVSPRIKKKEHLEAVYAWAHTLLAYTTTLCCMIEHS